MSCSYAKVFTLICAVAFCATQQATPAEAANILGVFTSHSPSHLIVHMSVVSALAEQGHNVTVVCSQKPKLTHASIQVIVIPPTEEQEKTLSAQLSDMATKKNNLVNIMSNMFGSLGLMITMQYDMMQDKRFTALYENPDTKFDLVMMGYFMNDFQMGIAAKFKCPLIVNWMGPPNEFVNAYVGNPNELAYVPNMNVPLKVGESMGFLKRIQNVFSSVIFRVIGLFLDCRMNTFYDQLFPANNKFPTLPEMKKNVSLVFCNSHFSEGPIRPNVPALVEIGGVQIKDKPAPLPKDINQFLNASKTNGAVLFSLGSNLKGSNIRPEIISIIFKALSSLPQNVIWKWEDLSKTPGNAPNILYKKWLPQDDILAHPNLKLFITHAGKGGLAEALYHGVPMVALPVFADQNSNAEKMESSGYGLQLDMLNLKEDELKNAIKEVLSNPVYTKNVQTFSKLYRDRPMTAKQNVVYWTEYVLRHRGAAHMQSPLVHLNTIQSTNLDVFAFLCMLAYILWRLAKLSLRFACAKLCRRTNKTSDVKVNKIKKQ